MADATKTDLLRRVPLFADCAKVDLTKIERLVEDMELPAGHVLTRQGRPGDEFFVIVDGKVRVDRDGMRIDTLGPGDYLGEISLVDHRPRTATAVCETACRVLVLGHREFHTLMADEPRIAEAVMRSLAERLRKFEPQAIS
jgi:CRP-like cAMP-binding protein